MPGPHTKRSNASAPKGEMEKRASSPLLRNTFKPNEWKSAKHISDADMSGGSFKHPRGKTHNDGI